MVNQELMAAVAWPNREEDVTVEAVLRTVGYETQRTYLDKMRALDTERPGDPLYMARTHEIIAAVGLMACLKRLADVNAEAALEFARDYWRMCDAGDCFGELLWEFLEEAGVNPALIEATPA